MANPFATNTIAPVGFNASGVQNPTLNPTKNTAIKPVTFTGQPAPTMNKTVTPAAQSAVSGANTALNSADSLIAQGNNESAQIASLLKSIQAEEQANAPGTAVSLNTNALNAAAQKAASASVNPLYTKYLNQYLQEEAANKQAAQSQNTLNLQGEQSALGNTLAQNTLQEEATASTNALTQGNINVQQQNYQLQSGNAQNAKLAAINQSIGTGNLGGSGLGQQQIYEAENARNAADAAQSGQFQYQRDTANLSTQDTFAQLAQSSQYAQTAEGQQEAQTNFNLNDYVRQAAYNDAQYREALAASKQEALTATTAQREAQLVQKGINAYAPTGSKNYAASEQAYSNLLNPGSSLPTAPSQNNYAASYGASV